MTAIVDSRPPPHDLDAEAAVLGAVCIDPARVLPAVEDLVTATDFYSEAHRVVWSAVEGIAAEVGPASIDTISIGNWLKVRGRIEQVGGMSYLLELLNAAPSVTNAATHARAVRDLSVARQIMTACQRMAARVHLEPSALEDLLAEHERVVADLAAGRAKAGTFAPIGAVAARVFRDLKAHTESGNAMRGTPTGFAIYDRMTGGLHEGDVTIIAARPGMGKTSFALDVARTVATSEPDADVLAFSLEMPKEQYATRVLCSMAKIDLRSVRAGELGNRWPAFMTAVRDVQALGIHIDDTSRSFAQIRAAVRQKQLESARAGRRVKLVVVDYLQLMKLGRAERRDIAIGDVTRAMKAMAKELSVPMWVLSQLNRGVESRSDKRPVMSDLRESGDIEQDADNIAMIYRDDYYDAASREPGVAEIILVKQRNGPTGTAKVRFDKEFTRFDNLTEWEGDRAASDRWGDR